MLDLNAKSGSDDNESSISMHSSQINCDANNSDPEMQFTKGAHKYDLDASGRLPLNDKRKSSVDSTLRDSVLRSLPRKKDKNRRSISDDGSNRSNDRKKTFNAKTRANRDDDRRSKYKVRSDSDDEQQKSDKRRGRSS